MFSKTQDVETALDALVTSGAISSWELKEINDVGDEGVSEFRNSEKLKLTFPNGSNLVISTVCSGCSENTSFVFGE